MTLYKPYDFLRKVYVNGPEFQAAASLYRKQRPIFKYKLFYFKSLIRKNFFIHHNEKFGTIFKFAFNKYKNLEVKVDNIVNLLLELSIIIIVFSFQLSFIKVAKNVKFQ